MLIFVLPMYFIIEDLKKKKSLKILYRLVLVNPVSCLVLSRGLSVSSHP